MKLAVLATGPSLDHLVAACHRQAIYVISIDTDTMTHQAKPNDPKLLEFPLGRVLFSKLLAQEGIDTLITGYCNDSLFHILKAEGIVVIPGTFGFVKRAIDNYLASATAAAAAS
jgi:predicted Fe-Mo cluster-binding NifX family protein